MPALCHKARRLIRSFAELAGYGQHPPEQEIVSVPSVAALSKALFLRHSRNDY